MTGERLPAAVHGGLAVYDLGDGPVVLLVPSPHGYVLGPSAEGELCGVLLEAGARVVTFDPPGAFRSTRAARLGLEEMVACCEEALDVRGVSTPVPVVAHSQATLCALAFALGKPRRVAAMVLVGAVAGGRTVTKADGGLPYSLSLFDGRFWQIAWCGTRLALGSNLAVHKHLVRLFQHVSYLRPERAPAVPILPGDRHRPAPIRDRWQRAIRDIDLRPRLGAIVAPTVVCVGRHDPQTPVAGNQRIAQALRHATLVVFEHSGHYPFIEERDRFRTTVAEFLAWAHSFEQSSTRLSPALRSEESQHADAACVFETGADRRPRRLRSSRPGALPAPRRLSQ